MVNFTDPIPVFTPVPNFGERGIVIVNSCFYHKFLLEETWQKVLMFYSLS